MRLLHSHSAVVVIFHSTTVESKFLAKFSPPTKSEDVIQEAVLLKYNDTEVTEIFEKAERLYRQASFKRASRLGLFKDATSPHYDFLAFFSVKKHSPCTL